MHLVCLVFLLSVLFHVWKCFCIKTNFQKKKLTLGSSPGLGSPLGRTRHSSSQSDLTTSSSSSSGLSFTACMSDFSLYVFHPYGAGKQKSAVTVLTPGSAALGTVQVFICCGERSKFGVAFWTGGLKRLWKIKLSLFYF